MSHKSDRGRIAPRARRWSLVRRLLKDLVGGASTDVAADQDHPTSDLETAGRRRTDAALKAGKVGFWELNLVSGKMRWSQDVYEIFGLDQGSPLPKDIVRSSTYPEDLPLVLAAAQTLRESGEEYDLEHRIVRPNGEVRWIRARGDVVRNREGNPERLLGLTQDITDVTEAKVALEKTEARYKHLLANIGEAVTLVDADLLIVYLSPAVERILGYPLSERMGRNTLELLHPDDLEKASRLVDKLLEKPEEDVDLEVRLRHQNGSWRNLEVSAVNRLHDPSVGGIIITYRDVTERTQSELRHRQSESRLAEAESLAHVAYWDWDPEKDEVVVSEEFRRIWGIGSELEITRSYFESSVHPEDRHRASGVLNKLLREGGTSADNYRIVRPDGSIRTIHSYGAVETNQAGRVVRMHGTVQDVSDLIQMEEDLRASKARLEDAQRIAGIGSSERFASEKRPVHLSDEIFRLYGLDPIDFLRDPQLEKFVERVHPDDRDQYRETLESAWADGHDYDIEFRVLRPEGGVRWMHSVGKVEVDGKGRSIRMSGTHQDVTHRRELEHQLRQSQKMEAIGLLAGGVAHDFNNLLTVINGRSQLALMQLDADDPMRSQFEQVHQAGEKAAELTHQLLAFSRRQVLEPSILDLNEVSRDVEKLLLHTIGEDIELVLELDPQLDAVKIDRGQMEQVLLNLAVNARDAMPDGGRLTVATNNVELGTVIEKEPSFQTRPGAYADLAVSDTGAGMDETIRERIFDPFFTTKERGKGTGLGLSTVYGIVKQSEGYIWAESTIDEGTVFHICLPRAERNIATTAAP